MKALGLAFDLFVLAVAVAAFGSVLFLLGWSVAQWL